MSKNSEPHFTIVMGGEKFEATRHNSTLWTFLGRLAMFNHILIDSDPEDPKAQCYVIRGREKNFGKLMATMLVCEYPAHLNMQELPDYIVNNVENWDDTKPFKPDKAAPPIEPPEWLSHLDEAVDE